LPSLDDTSITTWTVSNLTEISLKNSVTANFVLQIAEYNTTRICRILFRLGDKGSTYFFNALAFATVVVILLCLIREEAMLESIASR
jgi:hypothetical protein